MSDNIRDRLRDAVEFVDLESWLAQYTDVKNGGGFERRLETCPACGNNEYKLYVNVSTQVWICYVCDWGRYLSDVTVLMSDVSGRNLFDVRKELLSAVRPAPVGDLTIKLQEAFLSPKKVLPSFEIVEAQLPGDNCFTGVVGSRVLAYARSRGLTDDEIHLYKLRSALKLRRFTGPFLTFPCFYDGTAINWQGRKVAGDSEPKYVSWDNIANWLWPLDSVFLDSFSKCKWVVLVEGVFDAIGLWRIGVPALCTFGKKISDGQTSLLQKLNLTDVYLMWDADAAKTSPQKLARGARGMRGEIEQAAVKLQRIITTHIVDLSDPPEFSGVKKPDPGEILRCPEVAQWIQTRLSNGIAVNSSEFFQWRLS